MNNMNTLKELNKLNKAILHAQVKLSKDEVKAYLEGYLKGLRYIEKRKIRMSYEDYEDTSW